MFKYLKLIELYKVTQRIKYFVKILRHFLKLLMKYLK